MRIGTLLRWSAPVLALAALTTVTAPRPAAQTRAASSSPQLLVMVVVDQLRFDYLTRYADRYQDGLKRLTTEGAVFERTFYPYLNTVTCPGHATIGTGALPVTHGIIMNEWWSRKDRRRMSCTEDAAAATVVGEGKPDAIGHSAWRLRVPTLADRLRTTSPQSRTLSLSMKPRSAIMMNGRGGEAVFWFADANVWATSTAFAKTWPPTLRPFMSAHPVEAERKNVWNRVHDAARYEGRDDGIGERPPRGWTPLFPHPLDGVPGTTAAQSFNLWERSPYSDAYLARMAIALVQSMQLGQRDAVDFLAVSFSALDYVGHDFGPVSHEVQDTLLRLDTTLGQLLNGLDQHVGRGRYALGLSADHGVGPIPESLEGAGVTQSAGRLLNDDVKKVAEAAMVAAHGAGPHVAHVEYTNLYLTPAARARVDAKPSALTPLIDALEKMPGVARVLPGDGLEKKTSSRDTIVRAAALSHVPEESGDAVIVLKPNWIGSNTSAATHGTMHPYDQHVPLIFYGGPFKAGRYREAASPADLAPTLASTIKLSLRGVEGKTRDTAVKGK